MQELNIKHRPDGYPGEGEIMFAGKKKDVLTQEYIKAHNASAEVVAAKIAAWKVAGDAAWDVLTQEEKDKQVEARRQDEMSCEGD